MSDTDVFREVDEDYRRERMIIFWRRYGALVLAFAVAIMAAAGVGDYWYRKTQAEKAVATADFDTLMASVAPGNEGKSADALEAFASKADKGLATLARMAEASLRQRGGQLDAAAALYHQIADDGSVDANLRDLSVVRLGYIAVDQAKPEPLIPRLQPIASKDGPWRCSAKEVIALLTARAGQRDSAAAMFSELADDPNAPPDLASRARALAELYRGK